MRWINVFDSPGLLTLANRGCSEGVNITEEGNKDLSIFNRLLRKWNVVSTQRWRDRIEELEEYKNRE